MTNRLMPVGSWRGAEAILVGMFVEIPHDDIVGDVAGGCGEVSALPEALAPVALADMLELLLDLARRAALGPAHEVADRDMGRDFDEHMDVIAREHAMNDGDAHLGTDLPDDLTHPQTDLAAQHLEPVFRRPDQMVAMVKSRVTTAVVAHSVYPQEK